MVASTAIMTLTHGLIRSMDLPLNWQPLEHVEPVTASPKWIKFAPAGSRNIELCSYFRNRPLTNSTQESLKQLVDAQAIQLTKKQIESIAEVLRDAALRDAFKFLHAGIQNWNGRSVVVVEGRWNELKQDRFWLLVPTDSACNSVQEIWFQASIEEYPAKLKQMRQALSSIVWNE